MENRNKNEDRDDAKVDLNDPNDVSFAAQENNVLPNEYKKYAEELGTNSRVKIAEYIAGKHKKK